jgi:hypothetical protein
MLGLVRSEAVLPDRALYLTFGHFLILNKTSLYLSLARAISLGDAPYLHYITLCTYVGKNPHPSFMTINLQ